MSHWRHIKTDLKCPLSILERAVKTVMPSFTDKIQIDEKGSMTAVNTWKATMKEGNADITGVYLKYRVGKCDVAFTKSAEGSWQVSYDLHEMPQNLKRLDRHGGYEGLLENKLKQEIGAMRAKEIARITGCTIKFDGKEGGKRIIRMLKPLTARPGPAKLIQ